MNKNQAFPLSQFSDTKTYVKDSLEILPSNFFCNRVENLKYLFAVIKPFVQL